MNVEGQAAEHYPVHIAEIARVDSKLASSLKELDSSASSGPLMRSLGNGDSVIDDFEIARATSEQASAYKDLTPVLVKERVMSTLKRFDALQAQFSKMNSDGWSDKKLEDLWLYTIGGGTLVGCGVGLAVGVTAMAVPVALFALFSAGVAGSLKATQIRDRIRGAKAQSLVAEHELKPLNKSTKFSLNPKKWGKSDPLQAVLLGALAKHWLEMLSSENEITPGARASLQGLIAESVTPSSELNAFADRWATLYVAMYQFGTGLYQADVEEPLSQEEILEKHSETLATLPPSAREAAVHALKEEGRLAQEEPQKPAIDRLLEAIAALPPIERRASAPLLKSRLFDRTGAARFTSNHEKSAEVISALFG